MNSSDIGRLGESKVISRLVELGWYPYIDISGKSPIDIIAWQDGRVVTIQVKTCSRANESGSYQVEVKTTRHNASGRTVKDFDSQSCDYLAVYIIELDTIAFIPSSLVPRTAIWLSEDGKHKISKYASVV